MSLSRARNEYEKNSFSTKKSKKRHLNFSIDFYEVENEKSLANHVLCESVAFRRYRSMIAFKSRDVIKMTKMTMSRND